MPGGCWPGQATLTYKVCTAASTFQPSSPPSCPKPLLISQQWEDSWLPTPRSTWSLRKTPGEEQCLPHPARNHVLMKGTPAGEQRFGWLIVLTHAVKACFPWRPRQSKWHSHGCHGGCPQTADPGPCPLLQIVYDLVQQYNSSYPLPFQHTSGPFQTVPLT